MLRSHKKELAQLLVRNGACSATAKEATRFANKYRTLQAALRALRLNSFDRRYWCLWLFRKVTPDGAYLLAQRVFDVGVKHPAMPKTGRNDAWTRYFIQSDSYYRKQQVKRATCAREALIEHFDLTLGKGIKRAR